jgi:hypothetical protein
MIAFYIRQLRNILACRAIHVVHDPFEGAGTWHVMVTLNVFEQPFELGSGYSMREAFKDARKSIARDLLREKMKQEASE